MPRRHGKSARKKRKFGPPPYRADWTEFFAELRGLRKPKHKRGRSQQNGPRRSDRSVPSRTG